MLIGPTRLPEVLLLEPKAFPDERGFFMESFNRADCAKAVGRDIDFVQDNHSGSARNVLRGLHYQMEPRAQAKLVRVAEGEVFDVAVDMRRSSPRFGQWAGARLSAENRRQLWVPEGFAHGFLVLSDFAQVLYKTSDYHSPEHERSLLWNDPDLGIEWPADSAPILSAKDAAAPKLADAALFG